MMWPNDGYLRAHNVLRAGHLQNGVLGLQAAPQAAIVVGGDGVE